MSDYPDQFLQITDATIMVCCAVYLRPQCCDCMGGLLLQRLPQWLSEYERKKDKRDVDALFREWVLFAKQFLEEVLAKDNCTKKVRGRESDPVR